MSTYVRWTFCVLLPEKYDYSLNRNFLCTEISAEVLIIDTTTSIGCNGIQFLSRVYLICYTKQIYSTLHHVAVSRKQKNIFWPYGNNRYITRHPFKINAIYPSRWLDHFTFIVRLYHDFTVFQCIFMYLRHLLRFVSFQVSQWFLPFFTY